MIRFSDIRAPGFWVLFVALLALGFFVEVRAQTAPALTFTLETSSADGRTVTPRLTWSTTPAGATCAASGAADWTGTKAAAGTQVLAAVSTSRTYTMACTWAGDLRATVRWTPPTTNTDGTPLTNLAGYRVQYGPAADNLNQSVYVNDPAAREWRSPDLSPAGSWFFGVRAYNSLGLESDASNVASKVTRASATQTRSLELGIRFPAPPVLTTVE